MLQLHHFARRAFPSFRILVNIGRRSSPLTYRVHCSSSLKSVPAPYETESSPYNSATLNVTQCPADDTSNFAIRLFSTISSMKRARKSALWLKVPTDFGHYLSVASHYGFKLHHVKSEEGEIHMLLWLAQGPSRVPPFATHHVGIAGCVIADDGRVLCVREKRHNESRTVWKFPGGLANVGEDIGTAAEREVFEETGVKSQFKSILSFRHQHDFQFGQGDLYFTCRMTALSTHITKCPHEISEAKWMTVDELEACNRLPMVVPVLEMLGNQTDNGIPGELLMERASKVFDPTKDYMLYTVNKLKVPLST